MQGGDGLPAGGAGPEVGLLGFLDEQAELCVSQTVRTKPQAEIVHDDPQLVSRDLGSFQAFVPTRQPSSGHSV